MVILSMDSGLERTGYAIISKNGELITIDDFGLIKTEKNISIEKRLLNISTSLEKLLLKFKPEIAILEQIFFNINKKTIISVAQAQGACLSVLAKAKVKVEYLTPLQIKQILTGYGRADKKQIEKMLKIILNIDNLPESDDVRDAIACGLAYCYLKKF
ncbi:crossover junction endodeoxyribonuclease RuvC [Candidatus Roizmanbacteria bacterium RIFCSPHIGHO2_02_FULL_37_13b]|uniref:Crossover junction endodeoxyribonuclease RuvC n=1 Tax=Candidatus Roizmanbacteria bacterium RIFCSPLOWO2_02_FULL_36_11 TaxID=1802071 RepID=A0A1F7JBG2_9BACT|nr:MAG: crossover junction endodeoxyribonuclease RuvC [Candidatus Roizmanbacteria bacterium RIFCSPHIGHO2_02_FULL_37_13b]OGK52925.1 MAG: crossover junction endodeoxyribonuclease RuvC [Candidatus Roizmanbacteria bacterium RIFCSPLOWO2_02_FULL_36_11]